MLFLMDAFADIEGGLTQNRADILDSIMDL